MKTLPTTDPYIVNVDYTKEKEPISFHHVAERPKKNARNILHEAHDKYEIFYLKSGTIRYIVEGTVYDLKPGEIILIGLHELHSVKIDFSTTYDRYVLQFAKNALPLNNSVINVMERVFAPKHRVIPAEIVKQFKCLSYFKKLESLCLNEDDMYFQSNLIANILLLMIEINRAFELSFTTNSGQQKNNDIIENVISYIEKNIEKSITLEDLEKQFYISKYYISHIFSNHMNISIKQYIVRKKIFYADSLIQKGVSANEASQKVGYAYYASFFHNYKKIIGHSPTSKKD